MNRHFILFAFAFAAALSGFAKTFDVDISTGRPAASNAAYYHGETIEFRAVRGRSVVTNIEYSCVYYQTNGMDSVWWHTDGLVFHPTNDVGAASYRFFLEGRDDLGRDWHANGLLRLLPSPGFTPNTIELPVAHLDFAAVEVLNPPWTDPDYSTSNAALVATIEATAPAPGNYAAVSNAAVYAAITNALQDTALESHASQLSQLSQSLDGKATKDDATLTPIYGGNGEKYGAWTINPSTYDGKTIEIVYHADGFWVPRYTGSDTDWGEGIDDPTGDMTSLTWDGDPYHWVGVDDGTTPLTATRVANPILGYTLGSQTDKPLASEAAVSNKANDAAVVHKTGDTMTGDLKITGSLTRMVIVGANDTDSYAALNRTGIYRDGTANYKKLTFPESGGTFALTSDIPTVQINAATTTNALQDATLESHSAQLSQLPQALDGKVPTSRTINGKALTSNISLSASEVGAATAEDVYRIVAGTNVILVVTNYNSAVHAPAMKLQHLDPESGQYVTYWDEQRRHGMTLTNAMDYTDAAAAAELSRADAAYAPRAWSGTTSALGAEAPAGVTWISTPETVIAGGYEYEKVITTAGAVWVLTSNGLSTGATTNSYFRVAASDGTELFSIEKTDSYLVGVNATGITKSGNTVTIPVNVVAPSHPYIRATTNLVNAVWTKEDENGFTCPFASVSWSGSSGAYVATVTCSQPQAFFYFEFMQQGTAKIKNSAKTEMTGGIIFNGTTYMPTVNGNKLEFVAQ